ncbi:MAG: SUMF1/EgtB/PvdO family nonheme iron enzyme [Acidobacteria bacterium]|nr:SUMF1/EgtB/PvdO family nonheme iron enzyme [Acidobacteriota bacterium]
MYRNAVAVVVMLLAVFLGLSACGGNKEEAAETEAVAEPAVPEIVPGEMVFIPAGEFIIGANDNKSVAYPEHKLNLPAFWIDKYEVTNMEFLDFSLKTGYQGEGAKEGRDWRVFFTPATPEKAKLPVVYISWKDAETYCKAQGKRLPTEEEWEKAARGTEGFRYPWGNEWIDNRSNTYEAGITRPAPIGQFEDISPFGVHDMLGNVQEWTGSWYSTYKGNPKRDSKSGKTLRVVRGQGSRFKAKQGNLWDRSAWPPEALFDFGCRCAKDATPEDIAKAAAK